MLEISSNLCVFFNSILHSISNAFFQNHVSKIVYKCLKKRYFFLIVTLIKIMCLFSTKSFYIIFQKYTFIYIFINCFSYIEILNILFFKSLRLYLLSVLSFIFSVKRNVNQQKSLTRSRCFCFNVINILLSHCRSLYSSFSLLFDIFQILNKKAVLNCVNICYNYNMYNFEITCTSF